METAFTALTTAPLVPLLERLYEEADAESPATSPAVTELSLEERTRLMQSKTDYLALFARLKIFAPLLARDQPATLHAISECRKRPVLAPATFFKVFEIAGPHLQIINLLVRFRILGGL